MQTYINETTDEERAFYGVSGARLINCTFAGEADGESALKETSDLEIEDCTFKLRYPLWHTHRAVITDCEMTDCDLSFEKSDVTATVKGGITSVKNPYSGSITAGSIGEIIIDDENSRCEIISNRGV